MRTMLIHEGQSKNVGYFPSHFNTELKVFENRTDWKFRLYYENCKCRQVKTK